MLEFAADFETSKELVFSKEDKESKKVYKFIDDKDGKRFEEFDYKKKLINKKLSKTWVYIWGIKGVYTDEYKVGYDINSFINFLKMYPEDMRIFFHNEKFDGSFILNYFFRNSFIYKQLLEDDNIIMDKTKRNSDLNLDNYMLFAGERKFNPIPFFKKEGVLNSSGKGVKDIAYFNTSVNNLGVMYSIKIYFIKKGFPLHTVEIYDSMKILNFSIKTLGEKFLNRSDMEKLDYDYDLVRPENRPDLLTQEDHDYLKRDIDILAESLKLFKTSNHIIADVNKQTIASMALDEFKTLFKKDSEKIMGKATVDKEKLFRLFFPEFSIEKDAFVRQSYKGGFCYVHPSIQNKLIVRPNMCVLDVNSLFPFIMYSNCMPYGEPLISKADEIENFPEYDYYFTKVRVNFKLKKDHIPSIMLKCADLKSDFNNITRVDLPLEEYLDESEGLVELIMSKDDFELMHQQYDILEEYIVETWYFKCLDNLFKSYIDKWGEIKIQAGLDKDETSRTIAKLFLNSLYGKFGSRPINNFKFYEYFDGYLTTRPKNTKVDKPIYIPIASAITAGARRKTIEASQKILEYSLKKYGEPLYFYSDTDSIHCGLNFEECLECLGADLDKDNTGELGLWKVEEKDIVKAKYIRPKTYLEEKENGKICTGVAGLPKNMQEVLTWKMFESGTTFYGKLTPVQVQGGVILLESEFSLKL